MITDRALDLLNEAKEYLTSAEDKQRDADADKWAAAERMWKANKEEGATQREVARITGISQPTAQRHIALFQTWSDSGLNQKPSFTEAFYAEINDTPLTGRRGRSSPSPRIPSGGRQPSTSCQ